MAATHSCSWLTAAGHYLNCVAQTATSIQQRDARRPLPRGCDEFDIKPIEFESLLATIRRVVANPK
jgi:hypothetical protein